MIKNKELSGIDEVFVLTQEGSWVNTFHIEIELKEEISHKRIKKLLDNLAIYYKDHFSKYYCIDNKIYLSSQIEYGYHYSEMIDEDQLDLNNDKIITLYHSKNKILLNFPHYLCDGITAKEITICLITQMYKPTNQIKPLFNWKNNHSRQYAFYFSNIFFAYRLKNNLGNQINSKIYRLPSNKIIS